jgi:hypothetical protein
MNGAALLAAALFAPSGSPAAIDFGPVQLGGAATHVLRVPARPRPERASAPPARTAAC